MSESLQGKIAVITGAASGIGLATTEALLEQGATVVMVDWNEKALNDLVAKLGDRAIPQVTNLLDADSCNAMIPEILKKVDHIDILYCNAGTYIGGDLTETTPEAIDKMLNLNVNAVMKNVHAVVPHMSERKTGDIIVTCSIAGHFPTYWEPVDWPEENLRKAKESGSLIDASEVADAVVYMLTRKRTVTIRDMLVLPTNFDRV